MPPGTTLNGVYVLDRRIGKGGMGEVYAAREAESGDAIAIKMVLPEHSGNTSVVNMFRREAGMLNRLHHEAIVRYSVFAVDPEIGRPYMAMEFAEGPPLGARMGPGKKLGDEDFDLLRDRIGRGLAAAHDIGIVHRDISPDNIILIGGSIAGAKIIDFGIARVVDAPEATLITDNFAGKTRYASPEQFGMNGGEVTGQSDIYSLGIVFAEALSGQSMNMGGTQAETLDKRTRVPDLSAVPEKYRPLIKWMLQPDPSDRPPSMRDVAEWRPSERNLLKNVLIGGGALTVVAAIVVGVVLWQPWNQGGGPGVDPDPDPKEDVGLLTQDGNGTGDGEDPKDLQIQKAAAPGVETLVPSPVVIGFGESVALPLMAFRGADGAGSPVSIRTSGLPQGLHAVESPPGSLVLQGQTRTPGFYTLNVEAMQGDSEAATASLGVQVLPEPPQSDMRALIRSLDTTACFFTRPLDLGGGTAKVEAFATAADPMVAFDTAFKTRAGFEAMIEGRLITQSQCFLLDWLSQMGAPALGTALDIRLDRDVLRLSETLSGNAVNGHDVHVFTIDSVGSVVPLPVQSAPGSNSAGFRTSVPVAGPVLVMAARLKAETGAQEMTFQSFLEAARYGQAEIALGYAIVEP